MHWTYDSSVDALTISLSPHTPSVRTAEVGPGLLVDFDAHGTAITIEVLDASTRYSAQQLRDLPLPRATPPLPVAP
jgi:uncharacterized protein YuzE